VKTSFEDIDLAKLVDELREAFGARPPLGYLEGRTQIRDIVRIQLDCSELEAEQIVDTMVSLDLLYYPSDPRGQASDLASWSFRDPNVDRVAS
jgi:hypothetical protein